jgi:hypothetical protein
VHRLIIRHCFSTLTFNGITEQLFNVYSGGWYSLFIRFYCSHGDDSMKNTIKPDNYIIDKELHTQIILFVFVACMTASIYQQ